MGEGCDRVDVGDRGRPVVHVAERHQRDIARMRREGRGDVVGCRPVDRVRRDPGDLEVPRPGQAFEDVAVGRKVVPVGHDHAPPGPRLERRREQLVDVDGRRVADDHLARPRTHERRDQVADPARLGDPVVPAADQLAAPLLGDDAAQAVGGCPREAAQRVAVEVDDLRVVDDEPLSEGRQRVGRVQLGGAREGGGFVGELRGCRWRRLRNHRPSLPPRRAGPPPGADSAGAAATPHPATQRPVEVAPNGSSGATITYLPSHTTDICHSW